ncbi:thioredoxin domain-containing protein 3 isoform X2 [Gallus gallus]|uniref:thioredoxin domain-containing protein 3 isoform X2 n=1 Tax=Gallus gallus TaxID=9031 RepID=UPI001AE7499F|nr:thioredoxin domain-containing protein 3 isoform X2 [Gallus gallus]XP_040551756.1 thioredoxin domain-containing protein 3 isoform X2 [Gallus gallus]XP_046768172.1 thioredoxin domain-containing protein 3 isoform X2 [Gallus gallus]XP_046791020.1 thioredoxin domain-containing protein 3 isoform X2 [Gallus gallus]
MAGKKKEIQLQTTVCNQNEWDEMLLTKVIDVYQAWCGPCKAVVNLFRKLKNDFSEDDVLHFAVAEANSIESLQPFRNKCEPVFLFCVNGKIIAIVRGANAPLLSKKITELVQEEREILAGQKERPKVDELVFLEEKLSEQSIESVEETVPEEEVTYSVGIIKPDDVSEGRVEEIKRKIRDAGFGIAASEEKMLTEEQIREFYTKRREQPDFDDFVQFMMSGPCHILIITKKKATDAIPLWTELHETNESMPDETEAEEKDRLQGTEENKTISNICDVPDSFEDASRQLAFFFPNFDRKNTEQKFEKTLALIRPCVLRERRNSIMQSIKDDGFEVAMQKEITLSEEQAREFYKEHENEDYFPALLEQMTSGPTLVLALTRQNAIQHWRDLLGPKTIEEAKKVPNSLRAKYAIDNIAINQLHGSSSVNDAQKELEFFFPQEHTLALIKPDAAKNHKDEIMQKVKDAGFTISKVKEEALTREMATQFYKDHEGKPFFEELVSCMTEGPSVIMVLTKENAVQEWRKLMGPTDPEVAKESCPESIRAQFAQNILSNAVHGSSNREHALESIEYVFGEIDID